MNHSISTNAAGRSGHWGTRKVLLLAALSMLVCLAVLGVRASSASATYNILDYKLTPSDLRAGAHPSFHYHVDPDATNADKTGGDDLKKVHMEFPPGLLGNPEAGTKCSATLFNSNKCPDTAQIGTMKIVVRFTNGSTMNMTGKVHVLETPTPGSAATIGFTVTPSNTLYRIIFLKTEVTGVVGVRSGTDGDYGLTLDVDNIPRLLTTIINTSVSATISDISVDVNSRVGKPGTNGASPTTGNYFIYNPTRCTPSPSKAVITSYNGVVNNRTDTFTNTNCSAVEFNPTASYTFSSLKAGETVGVQANFALGNFANGGAGNSQQAIQQSHVKTIQTDLPTGTSIDFPAIGNQPLCSEAVLNVDACPANTKIGTVSAGVPFLAPQVAGQPSMTGDVYMIGRDQQITFGYILRGGPGISVKAPLKGTVKAVDVNNDGIADLVRATALDMPQALWSNAIINFTTKMIKIPTNKCNVVSKIGSLISGWSGASKTLNQDIQFTDCITDPIAPVVTIDSPANPTTTSSSTISVAFHATDNVGVTGCTKDGVAVTSPFNVSLVPGLNNIKVICKDAAQNAGEATVAVTYVPPDVTPPTVTNVLPQNGTTTQNPTIQVSWTVFDANGATCTVNGNAATSPTTVNLVPNGNVITLICADPSNNKTTTIINVTREASPPVVTINTPSNGSNSATTPVNVNYSVTGTGTSTCTVNGNASASTTTNPVTIVAGPNTITVFCQNTYGTDTKSVTVNGVVPVATITSPANNFNTALGSVNVTFQVDGASSIPAGTTCKINGTSTTSVSTNSVALPNTGANAISLVCTSALGDSTSTINVNKGPVPSVVITAPASGSTSTSNTTNVKYTVDGSTTLAAGTTCKVNGTSSTDTQNNSRAVALGSNTYTVSCANAYGTAPDVFVTVTGVKPAVVITSPANNSTTSQSTTTIVFTVDSSSTIPANTQCTVNGTATTTTTVNNVALPTIGDNVINVACTNPLGTTTTPVTVKRGNLPAAAITAPGNNSNSAVSPINVSYNIDGGTTFPSGVTCKVNGVSSTSTSTNSVALGAGPNPITVICSNTFGDGPPSTVTVNGVAPTVNITSPTSPSYTTLAAAPVSFQVNGGTTIPAGTTCSINGTPTSTTQNVSVALANGANNVAATCIGPFGTTTSTAVVINRGVAPTVSISAPTANQTFTSNPVNVAYGVTGDGTITCKVNNVNSASFTTNPVNIATGSNTIPVQCTSEYGADTKTVTVSGVPNVVTIQAPTNGTVTTQNSINVDFKVNGVSAVPAGSTCTINGVATSTTTGVSTPLPNAGNNVITVSCTGTFGPGSAQVTVDKGVPPNVSITEPTNNTNVTNTPVNVKFTVNGSTTIPANTACVVNATATTSTQVNAVPVVLGPNSISVTCTNTYGASTPAVINVNGVKPAVSITSPANGLKTTLSSINVAYQVDGSASIPAGTSCTINGAASSSATTNAFNLAIGANNIAVTCTNPFGSTVSSTVTVTRGTAPVITITSPAPNTTTTLTTADIVWGVTGSAPITCTMNGVTVTPGTTPVTLVAGANTFTFICTNDFGQDTKPITINQGNKPAVSITAPVDGLKTVATNVNVTYNVSGAATITCTLNGTSSPAAATNNTVNVPLSLGDNVITIICTNSFGSDTKVVTVTRGTAPTASITSPTNGLNTTNTSVNVAYSVGGTAPVTCTVNGAPSSSTTTNNVNLNIGGNPIVVHCDNAFGSVDSATVTVNRGIAPTVAITSPADQFKTAATSVNVAYTVNNSTTIPANTTCTVNGAASSGGVTNTVSGLIIGNNTVTVACNNVFGSDSKVITVIRGNVPAILIPTPTENQNIPGSTTTLTYTVDGSSTLPGGTTCTLATTANPTPVAITATTINNVALSGGANDLTVACLNAFGPSSLTRHVTSGNVPAVQITDPVNNGFTTNATTSVTFKVNSATTIPGGTTCAITTTAVPASTSVTATTVANVALNSGANTIRITCTNSFGSGFDQITYNRGIAPTVSISSPANNSTTKVTPINVAYTVGGTAPVVCTVNGAASASTTTNSVVIAPGANTITVICNNDYGTAQASITVTGIAPAVIVTAPTTGTNTASATTTVTFSVDGGNTIPAGNTCTLNGTSVSSTTVNNVALNLGPNTLTVVCNNAFGASTGAAQSVTVTRGNPPVAAITSPANNSNSKVTPINVAYTVDGTSYPSALPAGTTCTVKGVSSSNTATNSVTLVGGANTIAVQCTNQFGTGASTSITVNGVAPDVVITAPATNTNTASATTNVSFTIDTLTTIPANNSCKLVTTAVPAGITLAAGATTTFSNVALNTGANSLSLTCTNALATSTAQSITVNRGLPPVVSNITPATNFNAKSTPTNLTYQVDGVSYPSALPAGTTCTVKGVNSTNTATNPVALVSGANSVAVQCANQFGTGTAVTININGASPDVVASAPANNSSTTSATTTVTFTEDAANTVAAGNTCKLVTTAVPGGITLAAGAATSFTNVALNAGANALTLSCTNVFGTTTLAPINVTRGSGPVAAITSPADGTNSKSTPINVAYTVDGATLTSLPAGTTCTVKGVNSTNPSTNSVALVLGANTITAQCTSTTFGAGPVSTITVNGVVPAVAFTAPANNANLTTATTNVTFTEDTLTTIPASNSCKLVTTAVPAGITLAAGAATTFSNVALNTGANTLTLTCTNAFGTSTAAVLTVNRGLPPVVSNITPATNFNAKSTPTNLTYQVDGVSYPSALPAGTTCTVKGVNSTNTATNPVALVSGANSVAVQCANQFGTGTAVTININGASPDVVTSAPANNSTTNLATTTVTFTEDAANTVAAGNTCKLVTTALPAGTTINAGAATSFTSVALNAGVNTLTVSCTNVFGTTTAASITVTRGAAPVAAITVPATATSNTKVTPINVKYTVDGVSYPSALPAGTTCTVKGVNSTNTDTNSVTIAAGANTIAVQCTSTTFGAGPSTSVTVNGVVPDVAFTAPANNANLTTATTNVTFTEDLVTTIPASNSCKLVTPVVPAGINLAAGAATTFSNVALNNGANLLTLTCANAFGTSTSASITVNRGLPPVTAITAPANNFNAKSTPVNVSYTIDGATLTSLPANTTCTVKGSNSTNPSTNAVTIAAGANAVPVQCTNQFGAGNTASININGTPPDVLTTAPANGASISTATTDVTFTINGVTTIPAGNTCKLVTTVVPAGINLAAGATTTFASVALNTGTNTLTASCTNVFGTTTAATLTVTRSAGTPETVITGFASPSSKSFYMNNNVSFTSPTGTSFECRINAGDWGSCTTGWTIPLQIPDVGNEPNTIINPDVLQAGVVDPTTNPTGTGLNTYEVRAKIGATVDPTPAKGNIWVDDRAFNAAPTVEAQPNSLELTTDDANDAGAHPDVAATLSVEGNGDARDVDIKFPDGLMGSLRAVPEANRCTIAQANSGTCPIQSKVGTISGTATSPTDGIVAASGTLFLVKADGLNTTYAAGIAATFDTITGPVSGDLGDIRATGGLKLSDQARNLTLEIRDIPRTTTTSRPFHINTVAVHVDGDTGGASAPLITNPHYCNDAGEEMSARPNQKQFVGHGNGWPDQAGTADSTGDITADYIVDNCDIVPFAPTMSLSLTNPTAGTSTGLSATVNVPDENSTLRSLQVKLPSFMALNFPSFGVSGDMCPYAENGGSAVNVSDPGTLPAYYSFDATDCPSQARVGTATLTTPLLDDPVTGYVYLIGVDPVPWLGISITPDIPGNPQGVNIGLVGFNTTPQEDPLCISGCQLIVQSLFNSIPDVPVSQVKLDLGGITGRVSVGPGTPALNPNILNLAGANAGSCKNSGTTANALFDPWRDGGSVTLTPPLTISGCNDPKINITAPAVPTTGAKINNSSTASQSVTFTVNGGTTIPAGVTCGVYNPLTNVTTSAPSTTVSVPLANGINNLEVRCSDAFGLGTATRRIDYLIPSVAITSPSTGSSTSAATQAVALGITFGGTAFTSSLPASTTCTLQNNALTPVNVTSLSSTTITMVAGDNSLVARCTNASGTGTSVPVVVTYKIPDVTIATPAANTTVAGGTTTQNLTYRINGATTFPAGTTCTINGVASASTVSNSKPLVVGTNTFTLVCSNGLGSSTPVVWTIIRPS